jgi:hypothetical protein
MLASAELGKSAVPSSRTVCPGKNFNVAGFGVDSVWMNMVFPYFSTFVMPIMLKNVKSLESF